MNSNSLIYEHNREGLYSFSDSIQKNAEQKINNEAMILEINNNSNIQNNLTKISSIKNFLSEYNNSNSDKNSSLLANNLSKQNNFLNGISDTAENNNISTSLPCIKNNVHTNINLPNNCNSHISGINSQEHPPETINGNFNANWIFSEKNEEKNSKNEINNNFHFFNSDNEKKEDNKFLFNNNSSQNNNLSVSDIKNNEKKQDFNNTNNVNISENTPKDNQYNHSANSGLDLAKSIVINSMKTEGQSLPISANNSTQKDIKTEGNQANDNKPTENIKTTSSIQALKRRRGRPRKGMEVPKVIPKRPDHFELSTDYPLWLRSYYEKRYSIDDEDAYSMSSAGKDNENDKSDKKDGKETKEGIMKRKKYKLKKFAHILHDIDNKKISKDEKLKYSIESAGKFNQRILNKKKKISDHLAKIAKIKREIRKTTKNHKKLYSSSGVPLILCDDEGNKFYTENECLDIKLNVEENGEPIKKKKEKLKLVYTTNYGNEANLANSMDLESTSFYYQWQLERRRKRKRRKSRY